MNFKKKLRDFFTLTKRSKGGFTLVELIVVIAILAILAGVAIPVYSGYVEKAEKAGDEQLLAAVNKAFTAAVSAAGHDITTINNATLDVVDGKVVANSLEVDDSTEYAADFALFFDGNETSAFKGYSDIKYDPDLHVFKGVEGDGGAGGSAYDNLTFDSELIGKVKASAFYTAQGLGVNNLMNKVDYVTMLAANTASLNAGSGAEQMLQKYNMAMFADLGIDPDSLAGLEGEELAAAMAPLKQLVDEKIAVLDGQGIEGWNIMSDAEKSQYAQNAILSNYAVLDAAKGMKGQDPDTVLETIRATSNFKNLILNSENENGVAQASAAYALYTAYAYANNDAEAIQKTQDPAALLEAMNDENFRLYLQGSQAKIDLAGYMAAMDMVNSSAENNDAAVRELLINGFTDPALLAVIQNAMQQ